MAFIIIHKNDNSIKKLIFTPQICLISLFLAVSAYGQQQERVAIINTVDDGDSIGFSDLNYLTVRFRETATNVLPKPRYAVMSMQSIVDFLGSEERAQKECKESSCLADLGRKVNADYVAQARIGRFSRNLTISAELYSSKSGTMVGSFTGNSVDISGLLAIIDEKAPILLKKLPGASGALPSFGGIGGVQIKGADYEFEGEKRYLASIASNPEGASLSFNGMPDAHCTKTPCSVELGEGSVRIIANLEQYEIADTTVSITRNSQNISIRLKPNFGILEIKSAYSDGIGKDERWNLTINGKAVYSFENRLSPNKYKVELSHGCYEDISFEAGINKDKREIFDMASHLKLKKGGLVLKAEQNGEPASEPVFVNGVQAGETPFSGTVPVCAKVEIGNRREKVDVRLKHNEKVEHTAKSYSEQNKRQEEIEQFSNSKPRPKQETAQIYMDVPRIRFGLRGRAGGFWQSSDAGSQLFDKSYAEYEEMKEPLNWTKYLGGWYVIPGLMLNIRLTDAIGVASELNYSYVSYEIMYGEKASLAETFATVSMSYQTIEVPILLKYWNRTNGRVTYYEAGYQLGFPVNSEATVSSGEKFTGTPFEDKFSNFRVKRDKGIVVGWGAFVNRKLSVGLRFTYPLTKLDKYGTINAPSILSIMNLEYSLF